MNRLSSDTHLDDSALLHLVDGDASAWETDQWTKHVLACAGCAERLRVLRRRTDRLSHLLGEIELPADFRIPELPAAAARHSRRRPASRSVWSYAPLRAAAVMVILVAPFLLVEPLRALVTDWVSDRWSQVATLFGGRSDDAPPPAPAPPAEESGSTLWFTPTSPVFTNEFASPQSGGALELRSTAGTEGSLEVTDQGAGEVPILTESSLRVQNSSGSTAGYQVSVPTSVTRVEIRIGDAPPVVLSS